MIYLDFINRCLQIAKDSAKGPVKAELTEMNVLAELIIPRCLQVLCIDILESEQGINTFKRLVELNFTSGKATLPLGLREENLDVLTFIEDPDASYLESYADFQNGLVFDAVPCTVGRFTFFDKKICYARAGTALDSFTGTRNVIGIVLPSLNGVGINAELDIREDILHRLMAFVSSVIMGQVSISSLGVQIQEEDEN